MEQFEAYNGQNQGFGKQFSSKVKSSEKYSRFGEIIRYMTMEELQKFTDTIDNRKHRLMFEMIYELGCRVGEFVRIRLKHVDFFRGMIYFPAENTKTRQPRWSNLPQRVLSEIKAYLKDRGSMGKRDDSIKNEEEFLFHSGQSGIFPYSEKAYKSSLLGATVVCLVPARTDTAWWHDWAMKGQVTFLRSRVKFVGGRYSAPFPSAIVVFPGQTTQGHRDVIPREERKIWGEDRLELFAPWLLPVCPSLLFSEGKEDIRV